MRSVIGFLLLGSGLVAGWQFMHPGIEMPREDTAGDARAARAPAPTAIAATTPKPVAAASEASPIIEARGTSSRTFSPNSPLFAQAGSNAAGTTAAEPKAPEAWPVVVNQVTMTPAVSTTQKAPAGEEARRELVRDIQKELKRVGCYDGEASGHWSHTTTRAMATYVGGSNASLPVDKPDVALLAMLRAEAGSNGCAASCGPGQTSAGGACVPKPVIATRAKPAPTVATLTPPAQAPAPTAAPTAVGAPKPTTAPLPGAMAIGGPKVEAGGDDEGISPSVTNPSAAMAPKLPPTITKKPTPPPAAASEKKPRMARSGGRDGTRAVQDIFQHPLGR